MTELEQLITATTEIVSAKWGPCSDYICEADRAGLGSECTATRGVVADVIAAVLAADYAILPSTSWEEFPHSPWIVAEPQPEATS